MYGSHAIVFNSEKMFNWQSLYLQKFVTLGPAHFHTRALELSSVVYTASPYRFVWAHIHDEIICLTK